MIVNVIVTHHRRPSTQISHKPVVLGYIVDGFGSFWSALWVVLGRFGWFSWWLEVVLGRFGWFRVLVTTNLHHPTVKFTTEISDNETVSRLNGIQRHEIQGSINP